MVFLFFYTVCYFHFFCISHPIRLVYQQYSFLQRKITSTYGLLFRRKPPVLTYCNKNDVYCIRNKAIVLHIAVDILYNVVTRTVIPEERGKG